MEASLVHSLMPNRDCPKCGKAMEKLEPLRSPEKAWTWVLYWACQGCRMAPVESDGYMESEEFEETVP